MSAIPRVRNLRFDALGGVPRHWHGGRRAVTIFYDNLSVFFPKGERFFVASVRAHDGAARDASLRDAVRAFCGQEGVHSREHVRYNDHLATLGYPVAEMERRVGRILKLATWALPARMRLAVTCALEHLTALLGHAILSDPRLLEGADPTMATLWCWHAAEENEHKSVAYDVFEAAGGTYPERAAAMVLASSVFWAKVIEQQVRMMRVDGVHLSAEEWAALGRYLFVEPGGMLTLARHYLAYYRPGFHPRDIDTDASLAAWQAATES